MTMPTGDTDAAQAARLSRIRDHARLVIETEAVRERWLSTPHHALGDAVPLDLAATDEGCARVLALLDRIEWGEEKTR